MSYARRFHIWKKKGAGARITVTASLWCHLVRM
jgi:hypothetical protein